MPSTLLYRVPTQSLGRVIAPVVGERFFLSWCERMTPVAVCPLEWNGVVDVYIGTVDEELQTLPRGRDWQSIVSVHRPS